jgi:hypothetical protein
VPGTASAVAKSAWRPWSWPLRNILDGIFYVIHTGAQWRQLGFLTTVDYAGSDTGRGRLEIAE